MSEHGCTGGAGGRFQRGQDKGWYIDDKGEVWDEHSRLLRSLIPVDPKLDFCDYVVRNLGFAFVANRGTSFEARLKPQTLTAMALASLIHLLSEHRLERIVVTHHMASWEHTMYGSLHAAMTGLVGLVNAASPTSLHFKSRQIALETLAPGSELAELLRVWEDMPAGFDRERLDGLLERRLAGRYVIVHPAERLSGFRLDEVGSGLVQQASYWLSRSIGLSVADQPDVRYGRWVTGAYREVMREGRPRLEAVDAMIRWPDVGAIRHCYHRLLLPFGNEANGDGVLLSAPVHDGRIDLRSKSC